jgi:four helix bundle protein
MSKYQHFEELPVWQEAARLYRDVLDLLDYDGFRISSGFRNQLDRAALSVSNNIAEGFDRMTQSELISFLAIARGSAGEVRSMIAVVIDRSGVGGVRERLGGIRNRAESCGRQITAWIRAIEDSPVKGKRHLDGRERRMREVEQRARDFRTGWLRGLQPGHSLYNSVEARRARGESAEGEAE